MESFPDRRAISELSNPIPKTTTEPGSGTGAPDAVRIHPPKGSNESEPEVVTKSLSVSARIDCFTRSRSDAENPRVDKKLRDSGGSPFFERSSCKALSQDRSADV